MINSIVISATAAFIAVLCAALGAYALTRFHVPGATMIMFMVLGICMFPPVSRVSYLSMSGTRTFLIPRRHSLSGPQESSASAWRKRSLSARLPMVTRMNCP